MDAELEIKNLKLRIDTLEQQFYNLQFSPSESDEKVKGILDKVGEHLKNKTWAARSNSESIDATHDIAKAFERAWDDLNNQSELQFLIGIVGKTLGIDCMPSYTAILDWIKAFNNFNTDQVKLIGKSAAIKLAKAGASKELKRYVLMAARNNDAFLIGKISELIDREKKAGDAS